MAMQVRLMSEEELKKPLGVSPDFFKTPQVRSPAAEYQQRCFEAGVLREVVSSDSAGRPVSRFYGDPEVWLGLFKIPVKRISGWNFPQ